MAGSHDYVLGRKELASFLINYVLDVTPDPALAVMLLRSILQQQLEEEVPPKTSHEIAAEAFRRQR